MSRPVRYYHDHEFLEDGDTIALISTGIVCEDGRSYYAVNADVDMQAVAAHDFLGSHVLPYLPTYFDRRKGYLRLDPAHPDVKPRAQIAEEVRAFLLGDGRGLSRSERELWAWYAAYDHVALCQLWGTMMQLPAGVPMFTRDLKDMAVRLGNPDLPEQEAKEHHALADARENLRRHAFLEALEARTVWRPEPAPEPFLALHPSTGRAARLMSDARWYFVDVLAGAEPVSAEEHRELRLLASVGEADAVVAGGPCAPGACRSAVAEVAPAEPVSVL